MIALPTSRGFLPFGMARLADGTLAFAFAHAPVLPMVLSW
jgi:hypothetical protein